MYTHSHSTVLIVGAADAPQSTPQLDVYTAASIREALATIRLVAFDLIIAGLDDPGIDVWTLLQRISAAWPRQRWILASPRLTTEEEILARSLGAVMVLGSMPDADWISECAGSLRRREAGTGAAPTPRWDREALTLAGRLAEAKAY